ncbi:MAG: hypothetical protein JWN78_2427 [Bacteroidota bacterium]|nr:hypothetical protein [Bacteroidota bacterium]
MTKLRKIIKDIVRQQVEYTNKMNATQQHPNKKLNHKKMIITDDGVGRH